MSGDSLNEYYANFGISNLGDRNLSDLNTEALQNIGASQQAAYSKLPSLTATGDITKGGKYGTYWNVPTANGIKYVVPDDSQWGGPSNDSSSFQLQTNGGLFSVPGNNGIWQATGSNPQNFQFSGSLPGYNGKATNYQVYDTQPNEQFYQSAPDEGFWGGFSNILPFITAGLGGFGFNPLSSLGFEGGFPGLGDLFGPQTGLMGGAEAMNSVAGLGNMGVLEQGLSGMEGLGFNDMAPMMEGGGLAPDASWGVNLEQPGFNDMAPTEGGLSLDGSFNDMMPLDSQGLFNQPLEYTPFEQGFPDPSAMDPSVYGPGDVNMDYQHNGFETGEWGGSDVNMDYGMDSGSPIDKLKSYLKTPMGVMRAGTGLWNLLQGQKMGKMQDKLLGGYNNALEQAMRNQFPYAQYQPEMAKFIADPMGYLQNNAGFKASQDFIKQAAARRNARTGDINSGYGAALSANALGQNAQNWQDSTYKQLAGVSGVGLPNYAASMAGGGLNAGLNLLTQKNATYGNAITNILGGMKEAGVLDAILKRLG